MTGKTYICSVCCDTLDPEPCRLVITERMYYTGSDPELCPISENINAVWVLQDDNGVDSD